MTSESKDRLPRSRQELGAARLLAEGGFAAQAVSRAYFAVFHAATEALLELGETRSKHSGIISAFGERFIRGGELPDEAGRSLRWLFERRNEADYAPLVVPASEAERAILTATRFVDTVDRWLRQRSKA